MTKIAVCFSGYIYNWRKVCNTWDNLFNRHNVDIFCHMYDSVGINDLVSYINPKKYIITNPLIPTDTPILLSNFHMNILNGILLSNKLKFDQEIEDDYIYDMVIKMDYNLNIKSIVDLSSVLLTSFNGFDLKINNNLGGISELCWISSSEIHDRISDLYLDINNIKTFDKKYTNNIKHILHHYIRKNNIDIISHNWNINAE